MREIRRALQALDDAFAPVRPPPAIDVCPCCRRVEDFAVLLMRPRSQLTGRDLGPYAFSVLDTVGSAADLRYLTGRMLQLLHTHDPDMPAVETCYGKLRRAGWRSWEQAGAIAAVFDALWTDLLTDEPPHENVGTLVCALGSAEDTLAARLARWARLDSAAAILRLHEFLTRDCRRKHGVLIPNNAFWDRTLPTYREVVAWLGEGPALAAVTAAFDRVDDPALLEVLGGIHGVLDDG
ncbi:hypothetical protein NDR87_18520 [Nocardia sp. CDC159]|uniref:Uncharacterized protein n=1 Tax=Nocardia pulmonis TaxID=2951408 RepID=A0A9X2EA45_9NOCA|nr:MULTISPECIES: hypothetical protein [Nocardia]MCM6775665.1 hypothetical protein [Nocardia pulmonis]MCM6788359.1 hypothetical protein [Nocardia sp. CDC159]